MKTNPLLTLTVAAALCLGATDHLKAGDLEAKSVTPMEAPEDIVVHPISAPYYHEDAFVTTDVRAWYAYHHLVGDTILGPGSAQVGAVQLRFALTHYLQLVAYKDGWVDLNSQILKGRGWNNLAAGLKWAFVQQKQQQLYVAAGVGYEFASGDDQVLQDYDEVRFWLSVNKGFGRLHLGLMGNYHLGCGNGEPFFNPSNYVDLHAHVDYQVCKWFSPVVEVNSYFTTNEANGFVTPFNGADIANLSGNKDANVVTMAVGAEVRPLDKLGIRAAYEWALSNNQDLFGHRWTLSAVVSF